MKKNSHEPSIQYSMVTRIILYVLMPLFLAMAVLCFLLQRSTSASIREAYQMMFTQNVKGIENAVLQSNYASSTMITYTENNKLLKHYNTAENSYQKNVFAKQIENMIQNINATVLGSFQGEMMILMNDGRMVNSVRTANIPIDLEECEWFQEMKENGQRPYWNNEMNELFDQTDSKEYVVFGRALTRYQEPAQAYALVRIPTEVFLQFGREPRFRKGTIIMFDQKGQVLTGDNSRFTSETAGRLYVRWKNDGRNSGVYGSHYIMVSPLTCSSNVVMYIGRYHEIFQRSEQILLYIVILIAVVTFLLVGIVLYISRYITKPILFFADRIGLIEQNQPELLKLEDNPFLETRKLEEGMLRAQQRIRLLVEEVRREAEMKEKARFEALKAQIHPHFLFNTLNAIRWKASINQDDEVADILSDLGILLGETYKNDEEFETIDNAVRALDAYVKIMQVRFDSQVRFFFVVPDQLKDYLIPRFCLQPLVENSFIHGMSHVENGVIALRGELSGGDIVLTLIDNGEGVHGKVPNLQEYVPKKRGITGIGLPNIHKRIQALYGADYGLVIDAGLEVGFKISLRIPARKREDKDEGADSRG